MKKNYIKIISFIISIVIIDQLSKLIVVKTLELNSAITIINNFFRFLYIKNTGAAFGILGGNIFLLIFITLALIYYLLHELNKNINNKLYLIAIPLIIGGALGNLIDRIFRGYVVDFISFIIFNKEMAIFNIADIFIFIGVVLYIIILLKDGIKDGKNSSNKRNGIKTS